MDRERQLGRVANLFFRLLVPVFLAITLQACTSGVTTPTATVGPALASPVVPTGTAPDPTASARPSAMPSPTAETFPAATPTRTRMAQAPSPTIVDVPSQGFMRAWATALAALATATPPGATPAPPVAVDSPTPMATPPPVEPSAPQPTLQPATLDEHRRVLNPAASYAVDWEQLPRYDLTATLTPPVIQGWMTLQYPNSTGQVLDALVLRLFPNGRPIYTGSSEVTAITVGDRQVTASVEANGTAIRVPLPAALAPSETVTLTLSFTTRLGGPGNDYGILNQSDGVMTLGSWFPLLAIYEGGWQIPIVPEVGDAVTTETALFTLDLTAPADLWIASTGEVVGPPGATVEGDGSFARWRIVSGPARELTLAAGSAWTPLTAEVEGVEIRYFPMPGTANAPVSPQEALQQVIATMRTYAQIFGPYPYRQLDVVEAPVRVGGYEYPGIVFFDGRQRAANAVDYVRFLLAHEVAHQWFYALVGNNVTTEPWLDESLATFATLLNTRVIQGQGAANALRASWEEEYASDLAKRPVGVNQPVYAFRNWRQYRGPVYYAGALMLDDLRAELGDETFFGALRAYVNTFAFRRATGADLRAAFENAAGRDLSPFFQRWLVP